jgi:hypothetical protein
MNPSSAFDVARRIFFRADGSKPTVFFRNVTLSFSTAALAATAASFATAATAAASHRRIGCSQSRQRCAQPWTLECRLRGQQLHRRRPHDRQELRQSEQFDVLFDEQRG